MIAAAALVISAAATVTSVFQTRVFANQLSATVWPYLAFSSYESDTELRYTIDNDGLGPAILRSVEVKLDGKPYESFGDLENALMHGKQPRRSHSSSSSLSIGQVLRPGVSTQFIEYAGPGARAIIEDARHRVRITVCYCSLLEQCWILTSVESSKGPVQVPRCADSHTINA